MFGLESGAIKTKKQDDYKKCVRQILDGKAYAKFNLPQQQFAWRIYGVLCNGWCRTLHSQQEIDLRTSDFNKEALKASLLNYMIIKRRSKPIKL